MIDLTMAKNDNERLALAIFKAMEDGTLMEQMPDLCTETFEWANSGLPTLRGQAQVRALMARGGFRNEIPILNEQTHFSADVIHIASDADTVFTERVDHHWDAAGRDLMTPHICGVIEIEAGRIRRLHDFYDVACYAQTPSVADPQYTLTNHRLRTGG